MKFVFKFYLSQKNELLRDFADILIVSTFKYVLIWELEF